MKLIKLNDTGLYIIVDDYNTKEAYDSRINKGSVFYKDEFKDIFVAEYSPASKVSRPVIACNNPYSDAGIKNGNGLAEINNKELNEHLKNSDKKFTLSDMEECFNNAKEPLKFGNFEQYKKYLSWDEDRKTEWDIELEMILVEPDRGGVTQFEPFYAPKLTDNGYVKIIKIN
jgi:hypothetical protein